MFRHIVGSITLLLPAWNLAEAQQVRPAPAPVQVKPSTDWVQLFDGKKFNGLIVEPGPQSKLVTIQDGVIHFVGSMDGGWLHTDRKYSDFTIQFDIRFLENSQTFGGSPFGNNGLILRSPEISTSGRNWPGRGFEMELWDQSKRTGFYKTGALLGLQPGAPTIKYEYDIGAVQRAAKPTGMWQHVEVIAHGDRVWTKLNGQWIATAYGVAHPDGHVGFQIEDGVSEIRNVRIQEHGPDTITPNTIIPLFRDGKLQRLAISAPEYAKNATVQSGLLRLAGPGGWLKTADRFTSYTLRVEFRTTTDDANGGVYLRQVGTEADKSGWPMNTDKVELLSQRNPPPTAAAGDPRWVGAFLSRGTPGGRARLDTGAVLRAWRGNDQWQEAVFEVDGSRVTVKLNGIEIGEGDNVANLAQGGYVGLEIGSGVTEFRVIEINGLALD